MLHCKFPPKIAFWGNIHNNLLSLKVFTRIVFYKKFPQKNQFLEKFHKIWRCLKISTQNLLVEKIPKKINLRNLFHNNLLCWKIFTQYFSFYFHQITLCWKIVTIGFKIIFVSEMHIDWNGPVVSKADNVLARSLDRKFGSRKKWNFKSGNTKFYTSAVVDRKRVESSHLSCF